MDKLIAECVASGARLELVQLATGSWRGMLYANGPVRVTQAAYAPGAQEAIEGALANLREERFVDFTPGKTVLEKMEQSAFRASAKTAEELGF
jgi:hypothetical protein